MTGDRENRRKAFEMIGRETLRLRLEHRRNEYDGEYGREAEIWLLEKDAEAVAIERQRFQKVLRWAMDRVALRVCWL